MFAKLKSTHKYISSKQFVQNYTNFNQKLINNSNVIIIIFRLQEYTTKALELANKVNQLKKVYYYKYLNFFKLKPRLFNLTKTFNFLKEDEASSLKEKDFKKRQTNEIKKLKDIQVKFKIFFCIFREKINLKNLQFKSKIDKTSKNSARIQINKKSKFILESTYLSVSFKNSDFIIDTEFFQCDLNNKY